MDKEALRVKDLIFLKQLEGESDRKVVWEEGTLQLLKNQELMKEKLYNTNYDRVL